VYPREYDDSMLAQGGTQVFRSIDWDEVRLLVLAIWALIAVCRWLNNSLERRGRRQTLQSSTRISVATMVGALLSFLAFVLAEWHPFAWYCFMPMMPGFFIGAITVGVHRDDNLLRNVTLLLNSVIYGSLVFASYPLLIRRKDSSLP
jgi:hypothetical protein